MTLRELIVKILEKKVSLEEQVYTRTFPPNRETEYDPIEDIFVEDGRWIIE